MSVERMHINYTDQTVLYIYEALEILENQPELQEKRHHIKESGENYRVLKYWESLGLLDDNREVKGKGWRTFSFSEMTYIFILRKLRDFGFSLERMLNTKESLNKPAADKSMYSWLQVISVMTALKSIGNAYLLIEPDGWAHFITMSEIIHVQALGDLPSGFILLNINHILNEGFVFNNGKKIPLRDSSAHILDGKGEKEVIFDLRGNAKEVHITKHKDGEINEIETLSMYDGNRPAFGEIIEKVADNTTTYTVVKETKRIK